MAAKGNGSTPPPETWMSSLWGGGFAGLSLVHRLRQSGFSVRAYDAADDVSTATGMRPSDRPARASGPTSQRGRWAAQVPVAVDQDSLRGVP